ncbi:cobyrinate a,c-diamide synthase [Mangrovibrevibacter kandeliae]|uniref:cobyrinate a,c-diamide synthase n=1 Tax=Mangrovibrevibacter kandeliae TaxID=2968473 RepID=UPI00211853EE|nr:cobyrinate a,c-diamide synthase [Aurantimonas sp. CSK15Z-1]MCQ8784358.1 cobyrinate a,c-diamide synthase [Aurantimonas sp. CSK15Z-1]
MSGLLIAAPSSGSGKTTVTLGLLRALRRTGRAVASAKAGPDFIDPAFHAAASGGACVNLDPWAMRPALLRALADEAAAGADALVVEGMMGLFDGAADGTGSAADVAVQLGPGVVLVVDCARQSHSVGALVRGFRDHRPDVRLAGLILNRVGSVRHEGLLRDALEPLGLPVLGVLPARPDLVLPSRHLGLVQADEHPELEVFVERAADWVAAGVDLDALAALARPTGRLARDQVPGLPPLGQKIAVARDAAFAFAYPHLLAGWRRAGAEIAPFSPLSDEAPDGAADAVFLPGGYPELHAGRLAGASRFRQGMASAQARGAAIYGECGGYMVLGERLEDADGASHAMLGLLPLETSFRTRQRHLGYRRATALAGAPWSGRLTAHEFHYATILSEGDADRLFEAEDALGTPLGLLGLRRGRVCGSFLHLIDRGEA